MSCAATDAQGRPCNLQPHDDQVLHRSGKGEGAHWFDDLDSPTRWLNGDPRILTPLEYDQIQGEERP